MLDIFIWKILPFSAIVLLLVLGFTWFGRASAGRSVAEARNESIVALRGTTGIVKADASKCYDEPDKYCARLSHLIVPMGGRDLATTVSDIHNAMDAQGCSQNIDIKTAFRPAFYSQLAYDWHSGSGGCYLTYLPFGSEDSEVGDDTLAPSGLGEAISEAGVENRPAAVATFYKKYWSPRQLVVW